MDANIRGRDGDAADKEKIQTTATEKEGARAAEGRIPWRRRNEDDDDGDGGGGDGCCQQSGHRSCDDRDKGDDGDNGDGDGDDWTECL